jgi:hypothetical protein
MKLGSLRALAAVLAFAAPVAAGAADFRPMIKLGVDTGGDEILAYVFPNGEVETLNANQGFYLGGGVSVTNFYRGADLELEVSLSFKYVTAYGENGEVDWTRYPLDVLFFYRWSRLRAGGGLTYHIGPELKGGGDAAGFKVRFENALGFVLQADYRVTEKFTAGVRYTAIDYETKASPATTTKSSGIGVTFGYTF